MIQNMFIQIIIIIIWITFLGKKTEGKKTGKQDWFLFWIIPVRTAAAQNSE